MLLITVIFILVYIMKIIFDIPYIINKEYFYIKGYTIEQSHGGADVSHERRSIFVKDEISCYSGGVIWICRRWEIKFRHLLTNKSSQLY